MIWAAAFNHLLSKRNVMIWAAAFLYDNCILLWRNCDPLLFCRKCQDLSSCLSSDMWLSEPLPFITITVYFAYGTWTLCFYVGNVMTWAAAFPWKCVDLSNCLHIFKSFTFSTKCDDLSSCLSSEKVAFTLFRIVYSPTKCDDLSSCLSLR